MLSAHCIPLRGTLAAKRVGDPRRISLLASCPSLVVASRTNFSSLHHTTTAPTRHYARIHLNFRQHQQRYFSTRFRLPSLSFKSSSSSSSSSSSRWRLLARIVRYLRIPFLVASVYQLGYQQGIIDYARHPEFLQKRLLDSVLAGVGCQDAETQVDRVKDGDVGGWNSSNSSNTTATTHRIARIARQILRVAMRHVEEQRRGAALDLKAKLPPDLTVEQYTQLLLQDEQFDFWNQAMRRLEGEWTYLLVESPLPNAFVTEVLPHHLFLTTSMLTNFIANDDELALVLGHELSHVVLGHISQANLLNTFLRMLEILLLAMDPTEGLVSLTVVGVLATTRTALTAAHSRDHEHEADELGIQLAARACFDTRRAAHVFAKMHQHHVESLGGGSRKRLLSFADTHPPTQERYERLIEASVTENADKYSDTSCRTVKSRMWSMLQQQQQQQEQRKQQQGQEES